MQDNQGVPAAPTGLPPASRAEPVVSGKAGIPNAVECEPMHGGEDGWSEWIHPVPGYLMQCCDCELVHEMQFAITGRCDDAPLNGGESDEAVVIFRARRIEERSDGQA